MVSHTPSTHKAIAFPRKSIYRGPCVVLEPCLQLCNAISFAGFFTSSSLFLLFLLFLLYSFHYGRTIPRKTSMAMLLLEKYELKNLNLKSLKKRFPTFSEAVEIFFYHLRLLFLVLLLIY